MPIKTILIIDDSPTERHILSQLLLSGGYEVSTAESGEEGIERAKQIKPDLILMDVVMPGPTASRPPGRCRGTRPPRHSGHHLHHQGSRKPTRSGACARAPRTT
jgi:CheY-like chemotaxis protein